VGVEGKRKRNRIRVVIKEKEGIDSKGKEESDEK